MNNPELIKRWQIAAENARCEIAKSFGGKIEVSLEVAEKTAEALQSQAAEIERLRGLIEPTDENVRSVSSVALIKTKAGVIAHDTVLAILTHLKDQADER